MIIPEVRRGRDFGIFHLGEKFKNYSTNYTSE